MDDRPQNRIACLRGSLKRHFREFYAEVTDGCRGWRSSLFYVQGQPIEKWFVPELRVLRLQHPMAFVGKNNELRGNALPLQRAEKLERLRVGHAVVAFAAEHQRGRLEFCEFPGVSGRRPLLVAFRI